MNSNNLCLFGLDERTRNAASAFDGLFVARVTGQHRDLYQIVTKKGTMPAKVTGKMMFSAVNPTEFPTVGDWVMATQNQGSGTIHHVLPRKSSFERKSAGTTSEGQIIASNVDVIFICMSLNENFNLRRLERYLSIAWSSKALPCVVLTKTDLTANLPFLLSQVESVTFGCGILACSDLGTDGYAEIDNYLKPGLTYAFIGSSGVGKSTIINHLMGETVMTTREIGHEDKGRHTTTGREMFLTPSGAIVIDTPGMRELQIDQADFGQSFADIETLAADCKFSDCTHTAEPHCAVREAIDAGILPAARLQNFLKMQKELAHEESKAKRAAIDQARWKKRI
jgi:ribosome biogenesis GTPase